jgi:hypothetical protein
MQWTNLKQVKPWDVQTKNASIEGGHCVVPTGYGTIIILKVTKDWYLGYYMG